MPRITQICVECKREMNCETNEVVVYHLVQGRGEEILHDEGGNEIIDFIVYGDKFKCPKCDKEVVTGFGRAIVASETSQEDLLKLTKYHSKIRILR